MAWWKFNRKSRWEGVDFSTLIPQPMVASEKDQESGRITLLQPRYSKGVFGLWLQPRLPDSKKFVRIKLEARGSILWEQMDGRRDVAGLAEKLLEALPEEKEGILDRVSAYVYQLECNNLIRFANLEG